jgi:uncharacterized protein YndB with AHSA1/START domain
MFETIAIAGAVLIAVVVIFAATRADAFHVERTVDIKAAPEKIFPLINDFHQWDAWTPYNKDPAMQKTFSGNTSGAGACYAWQGNKQVGKGSIEITVTTPPTRVALDLHMMEPFEAHNKVVFTLSAAGDTTSVTWGMDGRQSFLLKAMGLFFSMDKMVGKDFEVGLRRLKAAVEK